MYRQSHGPRHSQPLPGNAVRLTLEQGPQQGVQVQEHKEKVRRALDPPSIIRLEVAGSWDHEGIYLVSPFLLMMANAVEEHQDEHGNYKPIVPSPLIGSYSSSLFRLKDPQNKDSAFFVFGDISCKMIGVLRLQYSLFELRFDTQNNYYAQFVSSIVSNPFRVVGPKEFKGLMESSHLSRTLAEQGVRMRLRKETRAGGKKRSFQIDTPHPADQQTPYNNAVQLEQQQQQQQQRVYAQPAKRRRGDSSGTGGYPTQQMLGGPVTSYGGQADWTGYETHMPAYTPHSQAAYGQNQYAQQDEYGMRPSSTLGTSAQEMLRWERTWATERTYSTGPYPALQSYSTGLEPAHTQALQAETQALVSLASAQPMLPEEHQATYAGMNDEIQGLMDNEDLSAWDLSGQEQSGGV